MLMPGWKELLNQRRRRYASWSGCCDATDVISPSL